MMEKKEAEEKQREAMKTFADGMRQHYSGRVKEIRQNLAGLRADSEKLKAIVSRAMSEKGAHGEDLKYEEKMLRILKDADVNALASKHLGMDFLGVASELFERTREARAAEEKYAAAVKVVDAAYSENMKRSGSWVKLSAQQRDDEIARIKREIDRLERKRAQEQKELRNVAKVLIAGNIHTEHDRRAQEEVIRRRLYDTESEISKRRRQIDNLRDPSQMRRIESDAASTAQWSQRVAENQRQSAMYDIDRRLKPKKSLADVVAEFESKSVGRLRTTLAEKITEEEKSAKILADKLALAEEFLLAVPVTDLQELMRRKMKLEK